MELERTGIRNSRVNVIVLMVGSSKCFHFNIVVVQRESNLLYRITAVNTTFLTLNAIHVPLLLNDILELQHPILAHVYYRLMYFIDLMQVQHNMGATDMGERSSATHHFTCRSWYSEKSLQLG